MPAPEHNEFALNNDGGAPPDNQNATEHGMYADPDNLLAYLEEHEPDALEWITAKHASYLDEAPFEADTAKAEQLLQVCVREWSIWQASGLQVREGVIKTRNVKNGQGEWIEVEDEHPVNGALSRLERDVTKRLKELGVLDSPSKQMADAVGALESDDYEIVMDDDE